MSTATASNPAEPAIITEVVEKAWRRRFLVLAVDQSAIALAVVFAAFALLILLGTQILSWPWLLLIASVGVGLSAFGVRRRLTDSYTVAQMLDRRLALNDSLSTAWFIHHQSPLNTSSKQSRSAIAFQLQHADDLARTANLSAAFPFQRRRSWIVTGGLALLALGLFSARYLVTHELSLQHSFLPLAVTQVFEYMRETLKPDHTQQASAARLKSLPSGSLGDEAQRERFSKDPKSGQSPGQQQATQGGTGNAQGGQQAGDKNSEQAKSAEGRNGDSKPDAAGEPSKSGNNSGDGRQSPKSESQPDNKQPQTDPGEKPGSMMDRMKDALSSVMAKIKPAGSSKEDQSTAQKNSDGQKSADQSGSKDQNADAQKDAGKEASAQEQSSGQQQGQGAAKAQASGKESSEAAAEKGSNAKSGVGHSDGDKDLKAAEQAQAMGKLAEIIGKRSASLTGEMHVEPSGHQRLQTADTHTHGQHFDLGGEINRDEVPVQDQEYVREYMELVRKKPVKRTTPK